MRRKLSNFSGSVVLQICLEAWQPDDVANWGSGKKNELFEYRQKILRITWKLLCIKLCYIAQSILFILSSKIISLPTHERLTDSTANSTVTLLVLSESSTNQVENTYSTPFGLGFYTRFTRWVIYPLLCSLLHPGFSPAARWLIMLCGELARQGLISWLEHLPVELLRSRIASRPQSPLSMSLH